MFATISDCVILGLQLIIMAEMLILRKAENRKYCAMDRRMNGFHERELAMLNRIIKLERQR